MSADVSEPYGVLKENIRHVVLNTVDRYNERAGVPASRHIHADLAAEIAEAVINRVLEQDKKPREWDAADAILSAFIGLIPPEGVWNRDAIIALFREIAPCLAKAALSAPVPEHYR